MKTYAETRRELVTMLKAKWPGVKFSVTKRHNSAEVMWIDGPTFEQVKRACAPFEACWFDGMEDLQHYKGNDSGIKYIFPDRRFSERFLRETLAAMQERYGFEVMPELKRDVVSWYLDFNVMWTPGGWQMDAARRFLNEREG